MCGFWLCSVIVPMTGGDSGYVWRSLSFVSCGITIFLKNIGRFQLWVTSEEFHQLSTDKLEINVFLSDPSVLLINVHRRKEKKEIGNMKYLVVLYRNIHNMPGGFHHKGSSLHLSALNILEWERPGAKMISGGWLMWPLFTTCTPSEYSKLFTQVDLLNTCFSPVTDDVQSWLTLLYSSLRSVGSFVLNYCL